MANSATLIDTIKPNLLGASVYEYGIAIDTIDTDLDVRTPASTASRIWVVGIFLSEGNAANLTFKSTSKTQTLELAANQGLPGLTWKGFYFATKPGEKLTVRSSAAIQATQGQNLVLRVVEGVTLY